MAVLPSPLHVDAPSPPADGPLIEARGLSMHYRRGRQTVHALREVDLAIERGAFVAVVGRSGAGKSTLLHLLAAMEPPSSGSIRVGPWHLEALGRHEQARYRRETIGMIFQQFNLVGTMTALRNVELPLVLAGVEPAARQRRARQCLADVGLAGRLDHRPAELSGGEQQRVAIARALASDPPLLLADEPTGNLDSATGRHIVDLLADVQRRQGRTVLVVTHHPDDVAHVADRILELHDGRLV